MSNREHGGNLDEAISLYGGKRADWLDLSTGINPVPWPVPPISDAAWTRLPESSTLARLLAEARRFYDVHPENGIVAAAGAQALIQILPMMTQQGEVRVLSPTYNEHAATFRNYESFTVREMVEADWLEGSDVAVIVNPNNPGGRRIEPELLQALAVGVKWLIVDEAFADPRPDLSLCSQELPANIVVLRSFGKFFGLAGVRLGFAVGHPQTTARIGSILGPWATSGPALEIGTAALADHQWIDRTRNRLGNDYNRLKRILETAGADFVGGTDLFVTIRTPDADLMHRHLADRRIWVRAFDGKPDWLRFGLPGSEDGWDQLTGAMKAL